MIVQTIVPVYSQNIEEFKKNNNNYLLSMFEAELEKDDKICNGIGISLDKIFKEGENKEAWLHLEMEKSETILFAKALLALAELIKE